MPVLNRLWARVSLLATFVGFVLLVVLLGSTDLTNIVHFFFDRQADHHTRNGNTRTARVLEAVAGRVPLWTPCGNGWFSDRIGHAIRHALLAEQSGEGGVAAARDLLAMRLYADSAQDRRDLTNAIRDILHENYSKNELEKMAFEALDSLAKNGGGERPRWTFLFLNREYEFRGGQSTRGWLEDLLFLQLIRGR